MFLSIIVAAYNVEKYIKKCIDSLLTQNIDDYEIIIINDDSFDCTDEIIKSEYINRVKYIKKESNCGLSEARNTGMKIAKGDYIMFVDSDDYFDTNILLQIKEYVLKQQDADIIYTGHFLEKNGHTYYKKGFASESNKIWNTKDFLISELKNRCFPVPACFAIYRSGFLKENRIEFVSGILHEDELWAATILLNSKKIVTSELCYYHYVIRPGSITQKKDKTKNGIDVIFICNEMIKMLEKIKDNYLKRLFGNHIAMLYMKAMCQGALYRKEYKKCFSRWLPMKYAYFCKDKIKAALFAISPFLYYKLDSKYGTKL